MNNTMNLTLSTACLQNLDARMDELLEQGVTVNELPSGELNFSGCHRGYCQAWD